MILVIARIVLVEALSLWRAAAATSTSAGKTTAIHAITAKATVATSPAAGNKVGVAAALVLLLVSPCPPSLRSDSLYI